MLLCTFTRKTQGFFRRYRCKNLLIFFFNIPVYYFNINYEIQKSKYYTIPGMNTVLIDKLYIFVLSFYIQKVKFSKNIFSIF